MTHLISLLFILPILALNLSADPILSSWFTEYSGQYARIYETAADESALNSVTTWRHPNNGSGQALPTLVVSIRPTAIIAFGSNARFLIRPALPTQVQL
mgnify:CR=1 FL=1